VANKTSDAAVVLGVAAAGLFFGLLLASLLSEVAGVRRTKRLLTVSVLVSTAAIAWAVWSLLGYDAVAGPDSARPPRDALTAEAVVPSARTSSPLR